MDVESPEAKYFGVYRGVVVDDVSPQPYHLRLHVPGMVKKTWWAPPMGTIGGGGPQRGGIIMPKVGADVHVMFEYGDINCPVWMAGHWATRDGASEVPLPARDVPPAEVHQVQCLQLGNLVFSVDERQGQRKLAIEDTATGDAIVWDLEKQGLRIKMTSGVLLECDGLVSVNGAQVTVQDRLVRITGKPV